MQADTALDIDIKSEYPFMSFDGPANVPNLSKLGIGKYRLQTSRTVGRCRDDGTNPRWLDKPVQLLARADGVRHIVNMAAICALDAIRQESYWTSL